MIITHLGHACFRLQDKAGSEGTILLTDPYAGIGLSLTKTEADIVTISHAHDDHSNLGAVKGSPFVIDVAGEYDIKNILVEGIDSYHDEELGRLRGGNIIYRIEMDGISLVHLGDLGHMLESQQLEKLIGTDILFIPVGGEYTINAKQAVGVISQIEPRMIIPMHYQVPGLNIKGLDEVDKFIKEIGLKPSYEERLRISKRDLPQEDMELVVFK